MKSLTKWKKIISVMVAIAIVAVAVILAAVQAGAAKTGTEVVYKETRVEFGKLTVGITESGSVTIGTVTQDFELDLSGSTGSAGSDSSTGTSAAGGTGSSGSGMGTASTSVSADSSSSAASGLVVEKVWVAAGQAIKAGDSLLSLTADSVASAQENLAAAVTSAELALTQAKIDRDKAKLQAEYELKANQNLGSTAAAEYQATLDSLAAAVEAAGTALTTAQTRIAAIPGEIDDLESELAALDQNAAGYANAAAEIEREIDTLENELENYENNVDNLESQLSAAKRNQAEQKIAAKEKYDENILSYQNAQKIYEIAMDGIDDEVDSATGELDTAKENLQDLVDFTAGNQVLATCTGTLTSIGYEAGDTLAAGTAIATCQDASAVTLSVSVAQDDISAISVGDNVDIELTAYENAVYPGTVTAISTTASSSNSNTVSYPVTVTMTGDVSAVFAGMTGNVTFITKEVANVLYVSNKAIINEGTKSYVKKKDSDGNITTVEVTTGFSDGYQVEIKSGLDEGDTVLIESQVSA